tara:strand:- start:531 stop:971 length:441 start_codon:yes stop_codon:yes gene_type:complete
MAINYAKHEEEFHGIFKLSNGEEVLAKAVLTDDNGETLVFMQDPIMVQVIEKVVGEGKMMRGMGFHKWMQLSDEEFFIIREKDVISVASMSKEVILMYETFLTQDQEGDDERINRHRRRKSKIQEATGYLGKVEEARKLFEKIFNT